MGRVDWCFVRRKGGKSTLHHCCRVVDRNYNETNTGIQVEKGYKQRGL